MARLQVFPIEAVTKMGREELFFKILIFFAVITAITSVLNISAAGTITLGDVSSVVSGGGPDAIPGQFAATGRTSPYMEGANTANGTVLTGIDFTTISVINQNVTTLIGGPWTLSSGQGLILTGLPVLPGTLNPSAVIVRNARSTGGNYTTNVLVDNAGDGDFYVFPRFIDGYSGSDLKVVFASDGVHVKKFPLNYGILDAGDDYFYSLSGSQNTIYGGSIITTNLTETVSTAPSNIPDYTSVLEVSKDGLHLFTIYARSILPGNNINDMVRHGGAGSDTINFIVKGFPNTPVLDTSETIISGSVSGASLDPLAAAGAFLGLIGAIFGLTDAAIVPFWLWAIVGLPCIATLIFMYIEIARGV